MQGIGGMRSSFYKNFQRLASMSRFLRTFITTGTILINLVKFAKFVKSAKFLKFAKFVKFEKFMKFAKEAI